MTATEALASIFPATEPTTLAAVFATLVLAYAIFALLGFGTALVAATPLAWAMPVAQVIPLLALLDGASALRRGYANRQRVDLPAVGRLLPGMVAGQALGVGLVAVLPLPLSAALLGGFVAAYGARSLWGAPRQPPSDRAAWLWGGIGGVLGGMFGSGGFVYASYLQARLPERDTFRASQAVMISASTLWRIALCAMSGFIDLRLLGLAALLWPAVHLGHRFGALIDRRLSVEGFRRVLDLMLIASGLALAGRSLL